MSKQEHIVREFPTLPLAVCCVASQDYVWAFKAAWYVFEAKPKVPSMSAQHENSYVDVDIIKFDEYTWFEPKFAKMNWFIAE
jgi:hypothetical protein